MKVWKLLTVLILLSATSVEAQNFDYKVLATNKTSTMEKELNDHSQVGFRLQSAMGGDSTFGGKEVVVVMSRSGPARNRFRYRLLATKRTSTMEKELQAAAAEGFIYRSQTVFDTTFGGKEVVVILERDMEAPVVRHDYKLLATNRTGTLEKELTEVGLQGFEVIGMTVAETSFGGKELVAILRRAAGSN